MLFIATLFLLMATVWTSYKSYQANYAEKVLVTSEVREQWDNQGDKNLHRGAHFGLYVFRPDSLLSIIEPGVTNATGQAIYLEPHRRNLARNSAVQDENFTSRLEKLTPSFVLYALIPLLIVIFSYNALSSEREHGTLRMLHSVGVRKAHLAWGKLLALAVVVALLVVPFFTLTIVANYWMSQSEASVGIRLVLLGAAYFFYYLSFCCISLGVSAFARSSRASLFMLLGIWLCVVMITPRIGASVAKATVPLPSTGAFWTGIQHDYEHGLPGDGDLTSRTKAFDKKLLEENGVTTLKELPFGANAARRLHRDAYADKVHDMHFSRLWELYGRQELITLIGSGLSPIVAIRSITAAVSSSNLSNQMHFENVAEQYRQKVNKDLDQWDVDNTRGVTSFESKYAGNDVWESIGSFTYLPQSLGQSLGQIMPAIAALLLWLASTAMFLHLSSKRLTP